MKYNKYVLNVFGTVEGANKWSSHGLYDPASNEGPNKYNNKIYRMQYVLEEIPETSETNKLALDMGCGTGIFIPAIKEKGYSVTGIDISSEMISMAHRLCDELSIEAELLVGDCNNTQQPENKYDICLCVGLIEHQIEDTSLLKEVHRLLKPGGLLIITIRNYICPYIRIRSFYYESILRIRNLKRAVMDQKTVQEESGAFVFKSREHIPFLFTKLLRKTGFIPISQRYSHFYFLPFPLSVLFPKAETRVAKLLECLNNTALGWLGSTAIICAKAEKQ